MPRFALTAAALLLAASCGGGSQVQHTEKPAAVAVRAYLQALRADEPRAAWELLSEEVREDLLYEEFEERWRQAKEERAHQARALEEGLKGGEDLGERARVEYPDGKRVSLERESEVWRLEAELISETHAGGARDAVRIFAQALADKDYAAVLRILSSRRRDSISEQYESFVGSLQDHVGDKIAHISDERAELQWDDDDTRYKIVLRKEGEEWRIDDIYIRPVDGEDESAGSGDSDED